MMFLTDLETDPVRKSNLLIFYVLLRFWFDFMNGMIAFFNEEVTGFRGQ